MERAGPGLVAVVGSLNLDVVVRVEDISAPGETVMGDGPVEIAGGKGLNQAVAAARSGPAALVGCVGQDDAGRVLLGRLARAGVDVEHVREVAAPTGRAFIQVDAGGENSIVVVAGANASLSPSTVRAALDELEPTTVLAQLEIPMESVHAAAEWAAEHDVRFVLNPSPVRALSPHLLARCDPLVLNAHESAAILGARPDLPAAELSGALLARARSVVLTDGPRGAHVACAQEVLHVPGVPTEAVDTTGAGDEFVGQLAASLSRGRPLPDAAAVANRAAARLVALPRDRR